MSVLVGLDFLGLHMTRTGVEVSGRPLGEWESGGVALGDATGGVVQISVNLGNRYLFSLESWMANVSVGVAPQFQLTWTPTIAGIQFQSWTYAEPSTPAPTVDTMRPFTTLPRLPMTGGFPADPNIGHVIMTATINTNLQIYRANFWGYYWDKRAPMAPEGLIRP